MPYKELPNRGMPFSPQPDSISFAERKLRAYFHIRRCKLAKRKTNFEEEKEEEEEEEEEAEADAKKMKEITGEYWEEWR